MINKVYLFTLIFLGISSCNNDKIKNYKNKISTSDKCSINAYLFGENGRIFPKNYKEIIKNYEDLICNELEYVMWYPTFSDNFPIKDCEKVKKLGKTPHLTWEFYFSDSTNYQYMTQPIKNEYSLMNEILEGKHDKYLNKFANDVKKYNGNILIRPLHEFNGNWYLWSGFKNGKNKGGPDKVVSVWRYVVDIFIKNQVSNVKWVWNPHGPSIDMTKDNWNKISNYWPGDDYVDWIAMDAYNWYPKDPWGGERPFRDFDNCFKKLYNECIKISKNHPIMIAEFGSPEFNFKDQNKALWIKDAFYKIKNEYPLIKSVTWFQINKELDWRVNSSKESLIEFKKAISDSYFY
ncbi:MAG: hypothetical protein CMD07_06125 [Flavobacteriales bacterium]|nr:hypothetical protein [Flavobacteriales bacterium]|tara:strand:- start:303 stop:1346 length:1044 start_codon:yes stop_codon:yes gene_type:complete